MLIKLIKHIKWNKAWLKEAVSPVWPVIENSADQGPK